jgi:methyl-accepting chemotaxis protein
MMSFIMPIIASDDYRGTNCLSCKQVNNDEILGAVKITSDLSAADKDIANSITQATILQLIITIISFGLLSYTLKKIIFVRLKKSLNTIKNVEENLDLNTKTNVNYNDEIGDVNSALNGIMSTFKQSFLSISEVTSKLTVAA